MKVYTKVVIDIKTLSVVEEKYFDYDGEVAYCKGGGGSAGSGQVNYPAYLEAFHSQVLDDAVGDALSGSMTDDLNTALGTNPYTGDTAYDPASRLDDAWSVMNSFESHVLGMDDETEWGHFFDKGSQMVSSDYIDPTVNSHTDISGAWIDPTLNANSDIATAWIDPAFDADTDITSAWIDPAPGADTDIASAWIDPTINAYTDISAAWIDPSPNADTDIEDDGGWVDPSSDAHTDISGAWEDPAPAAAAEIQADVEAYEDIIDDRVNNDSLPRFRRGMQNVNAVSSSAFVVGQALIEAMANRDVAKYQGTLRVAAFTQKDQLIAASKLGKSNAIAQAHLKADEVNAISRLGESNSKATAYLKADEINAISNLAESNALAVAHTGEDKIAADGNLSESNALAQAHIKADEIAATSKLGESNALSIAHTQEDKIDAESNLGESNALAQAHIEIDRIGATNNLAESNALANAHITQDKINSISVLTENTNYLTATGQIVDYYTKRLGTRENMVRMIVELNRISIVAEKEEAEYQIEIDVSEASWDLNVWQYAANVIAAPAGGTLNPGIRTPSTMQSVLGGAMSGAAVGATVGGPQGAGIGAVAGAVMGYMSS